MFDQFKLHIEVLYLLLTWFFAFDHVHYARWLTIHWFDMYNLESKFPDFSSSFQAEASPFRILTKDFGGWDWIKYMSRTKRSSRSRRSE